MTTIPPDQIKDLLRLCEAATLGINNHVSTYDIQDFAIVMETALPALLQERAGLVERIERLEKALGRTMVGGNHLANILLGKLGGDFHGKYPATLTPDEGLQLIGSNDQYDAWSCWREIILTRVVLQPESKTSWASQIERLSTLLQRPSPMCVVTI